MSALKPWRKGPAQTDRGEVDLRALVSPSTTSCVSLHAECPLPLSLQKSHHEVFGKQWLDSRTYSKSVVTKLSRQRMVLQERCLYGFSAV